MRRIPGSHYARAGGLALAVVFVSGVLFLVWGEIDRQTQASTPLPACPPPEAYFPSECQRLQWQLGPRQEGYASGSCNAFNGLCVGSPLPLEEARVSGNTVRDVVKSETPGDALKYHMSSFLWNFRFGVNGRPMRVRLYDGQGRFAWSAGYDGDKRMWVNARSEFQGLWPDLRVAALSRSYRGVFRAGDQGVLRGRHAP